MSDNEKLAKEWAEGAKLNRDPIYEEMWIVGESVQSLTALLDRVVLEEHDRVTAYWDNHMTEVRAQDHERRRIL